MRWYGAVVLTVGLLWGGACWASPVIHHDEFGAINGRLFPQSRYCPESPEPPEPCPTSLTTLCEAGKYTAEIKYPRLFLDDLADALRLRGLPVRAKQIWGAPSPLPRDRSEEKADVFAVVLRKIHAAKWHYALCQTGAARQSLIQASAEAVTLEQPYRVAATAYVVYHQARLGFHDDARATYSRLIEFPLPAEDDVYLVDITYLTDRPDVGITTMRSLYRTVATAAAALGHFELAVANMPHGKLSVAHLIAQLAIEQGRTDVALAIARSDIRYRSVVYQSLINRGQRNDVRAIVDARMDSDRGDFEQVALAWAATDPQTAVAYVRRYDRRYIASALITCAALAGNAQGALSLLRGRSGIAAFRKYHAQQDHWTSAAREEVDFAAAVGYTALALAEHGRRRDALKLLAETESLFIGLGFYPRIGGPAEIIAETYAYLGEPVRGLTAIERDRQVRGDTPEAESERNLWRTNDMGKLIGAHAYALAHREEFDKALGLLSVYPDHRETILLNFAAGAAHRDAPLPFPSHMESRYTWWQVVGDAHKSTGGMTHGYPRD